MSVGYHDRTFRPVAHPERSQTLQKLARFGYLMKGGIYGLIGILALLAAFGESEGQVGGQKEAVTRMSATPFGDVLCVMAGIGLLAYAGWRAIEAVLDVRDEGTDSKGLAKRAGYAGSALMNGAVGVFALDLAFGFGGSGNGGASTFAGKMMESTLGSVVLGIIGLGFIVFGLAQIGQGWTAKFVQRLRTQQMNEKERTWAVRAGRIGYIARGIVFTIVGGFVLQALFTNNPGEARGLGGALQEIASQPYGQILLVLVAAGLVAYGAYQVVFAKYGRLVGR